MLRINKKRILAASVSSVLLSSCALAGDPLPILPAIVQAKSLPTAPSTRPEIIQVQDQPPSLLTPPSTDTTPGASRFGTQQAESLITPNTGSDTSNRQSSVSDSSGSSGTSLSGAGGAGASAVNSQEIGDFLSKSASSTGIDIQQRNALSADPRLRGYHVGQLSTLADGVNYFPARQDLDTAIAKFDASSIRDIVIFRGPYTSVYGPGFSFLDVATLDSPRYQCGFERHGRTAIRYQTNGQGWDAVQSVSMGSTDWGARLTYSFLQGNDYQAGDGIEIANSYLAHNVNLALGFDLSDKSSLEFKLLRVRQNNLEFPGLYFDIRQLDTEAYSARYTLRDQNWFDKLTLDVWYNNTTARGDTQNWKKQSFVRQLLDVSFNPEQSAFLDNGQPRPQDSFYNQFHDASTSDFSNKSLGYRGALSWGGGKNAPHLIVGTDLMIFGQNLVENIQLIQVTGNNINTGEPVNPNDPAVFTQRQTIPNGRLINPGLFTELSMPFGEALTLRTGGRLDWVNTRADSRLITGNINLFGPPQTFPEDPVTVLDPIIYSTNPNTTTNTRDFQLYSAFLSGEWKLDENIVVSAGYAHAMRAPTMTELYAAGPFLGVLQQGTTRVIGDPNLEPETLNQIDLGIRANYGWVRGSLTGFYSFFENYITYDQNVGGLGLNQVVVTNTDRARLAGFEAYSQVEATRWLTYFNGISYVQGVDLSHRDNRRPEDLVSSRRNDPATGQYASVTEPLWLIPPLDIRNGLRIHESLSDPNQAPKWAVEFVVRTVMSQNNIAYSLGEIPTAGFTTYSIRSFWQYNENLLFTAGIENIFDKLYIEHMDPVAGNQLGVGPFYRQGVNYYFGAQVSY